MARIHDADPKEGAALLKDGNNHILLIHAHDETEEMEPGYFMTFIDELIRNGVEFIEPEFFTLAK